jgi:phage baseplate assembly protein W
MTTSNKYRDFALNFRQNPITGDLAMLTDEKSVNQSLKNLIFMNFYDVPFEPKIGSNVRARLFDLITSTTADTIKSDIKDVIENFEPRIEVISIDVKVDEAGNGINVTLRYRLRTSTNDITVSYFLERII